MLIKLIVVNANHFIRYKCKITHCLDSQTLSNYISTVAEVLEVLLGVGTFTSTSSFDRKSLQFVTMSELKKAMPGGF